MELFEIVEKAQEDYNLPKMNEEEDGFVFKVNGITIEFRNNQIVNKRKRKKYNYSISVGNDDFGKGCVFNEYEEIKYILDSVQEIRKCD